MGLADPQFVGKKGGFHGTLGTMAKSATGPFLSTVGSCARAMADKETIHHQDEFLHNYTFVSLHDSDHGGVVRFFVALSCEL